MAIIVLSTQVLKTKQKTPCPAQYSEQREDNRDEGGGGVKLENL